MVDPATPKPPVPGVPARKDPNPPAKQPSVPVNDPRFPVKGGPQNPNNLQNPNNPQNPQNPQDKHYPNPEYTLDPTKERYPEVNPDRPPTATRPGPDPVPEAATMKRVFVGSPYPTVAHRDSYKETNTPLGNSRAASSYPDGGPRNVNAANSPNYDARFGSNNPQNLQNPQNPQGLQNPQGQTRNAYNPNVANYDERLDSNKTKYDARFDSNSPKFDADFAAKHPQEGAPKFSAGNPSNAAGTPLNAAGNPSNVTSQFPAGDPRNVSSQNSPNYDARLDHNSPKFDAAFAAKFPAGAPRRNP